MSTSSGMVVLGRTVGVDSFACGVVVVGGREGDGGGEGEGEEEEEKDIGGDGYGIGEIF